VRCCEGNEAAGAGSSNGGVNGRIGPRGSCIHVQAFKHGGGLEMAKPVMQYLCICRHHILGHSPVSVRPLPYLLPLLPRLPQLVMRSQTSIFLALQLTVVVVVVACV
jgi:hypothetical protein